MRIGQRQVSTLFTQLNQYHVIMEVKPEFQARSRPSLQNIYIRSAAGGSRAAQRVHPLRAVQPRPS